MLGKVGMTGEEVSEGFSAELRKPSRSWQKTKRWGQQVSPLALLTQPLEAWTGVMALEAGGCDAHAGSPSLPRSRSKISLPCLFPGSLLKLRFHAKRGAFNESGCKPLPFTARECIRASQAHFTDWPWGGFEIFLSSE